MAVNLEQELKDAKRSLAIQTEYAKICESEQALADKEIERLRAALVRAYDLVKLGRYQMADNELRKALQDNEKGEGNEA